MMNYVGYEQFKGLLNQQLSNNNQVLAYCPICYMPYKRDTTLFKLCSYGCGPKKPISEYYNELTEGV